MVKNKGSKKKDYGYDSVAMKTEVKEEFEAARTKAFVELKRSISHPLTQSEFTQMLLSYWNKRRGEQE